MRVAYEVKYWDEVDTVMKRAKGVCFGNRIGEIVEDIEEYYGKYSIDSVSYEYDENYDDNIYEISSEEILTE